MADRYEQVLQLVDQQGILRARDLTAHNIPRVYLQRLVERGDLERIERGLYRRPEAEISLYHSLAAVAKRVPTGTVCLLSALAFHELTTQLPYAVWLALPQGMGTPAFSSPPLRVVRVSGKALCAGVEVHHIEQVPVRIYSVAKTVVDCFKFRNKIGVDVAVESLRECIAERRCSIDELTHYAAICRMSRVMQPYLEALA